MASSLANAILAIAEDGAEVTFRHCFGGAVFSVEASKYLTQEEIGRCEEDRVIRSNKSIAAIDVRLAINVDAVLANLVTDAHVALIVELRKIAPEIERYKERRSGV